MSGINKKEPIVLFLGDILIFVISLWLTLFLRNLNLPDWESILNHLIPFSLLFVVWTIFFYVAGLYEKHTLILKSTLPTLLFNTQMINSVVAVIFFYFIPYFGITPKVTLFINLIVSLVLIFIWRLVIFSKLKPLRKQNAVLIGSGAEMNELRHEINNNNNYSFYFVQTIDLDKLDPEIFKDEVVRLVYEQDVSLIAVDIKNPNIESVLPQLYNLIFAKVQFIDINKMYESIFDRVPLSVVKHNWFIENISSKNHITYDILKRLMDIVVASILFLPSLLFYPFVIVATFLEDRKNVFMTQNRIGQNNKIIKIYKFRTMTYSDEGVWPEGSENKITKVGKILRSTRVDELPQLWNVIKGDLSLIGPRPDICGLFENLKQNLPYYNIRNIVKPGLSGWAQTHQEIPPHSLEETKTRLAYDLYYIKNRSFMLDLKIALQTLKTLISRTGK
jgi:lipopolysaccharide/colanic/teichoic acid biosynthesis glycosyltransferase